MWDTCKQVTITYTGVRLDGRQQLKAVHAACRQAHAAYAACRHGDMNQHGRLHGAVWEEGWEFTMLPIKGTQQTLLAASGTADGAQGGSMMNAKTWQQSYSAMMSAAGVETGILMIVWHSAVYSSISITRITRAVHVEHH